MCLSSSKLVMFLEALGSLNATSNLSREGIELLDILEWTDWKNGLLEGKFSSWLGCGKGGG